MPLFVCLTKPVMGEKHCFEVSCELLVCSIVQRDHSTIPKTIGTQCTLKVHCHLVSENNIHKSSSFPDPVEYITLECGVGSCWLTRYPPLPPPLGGGGGIKLAS